MHHSPPRGSKEQSARHRAQSVAVLHVVFREVHQVFDQERLRAGGMEGR